MVRYLLRASAHLLDYTLADLPKFIRVMAADRKIELQLVFREDISNCAYAVKAL